MTKYTATVTAVTVHRVADNPIYGEGTTKIELDDESAGGFFQIRQGDHVIRVELDELKMILEQATEMLERYSP